jgi:serralysin
MTDTSTTVLWENHAADCPCCAALSSLDNLHAAGTSPTLQYPSGLHKVGDLNLSALLFYRNEKSANGVYTYGFTRWNADLLAGKGLTQDQARNSDIGVGTPVTLNYHFQTVLAPGLASDRDWNFRPLNDDERKVVLEELKKISDVTGITFVESPTNVGKTLGFSVIALSAGTAGSASTPNVSTSYSSTPAGWVLDSVGFTDGAGEVFLSRSVTDGFANGGLTEAERARLADTVRHEIGHALGLSHPFNGPTVLPDSAQNKFYTMMSYSDSNDLYYGIANGAYLKANMTGMGVLDILALQHLYGPNTTYRIGNDTYTWDQKVGFREVIYDAGGTDTFDLSVSTMKSEIDLTAEYVSSVNMRVTEAEMRTNLSTGYQTSLVTYKGVGNLAIVGTIENVKAGSGNDRINGNAVNNEISGGAGNDSIWGGAGDDRLILGAGNDRVVAGSGNDFVDGGTGIDVAGLFGPHSSYTIARQADGSLKVSGPDGTDTYAGTEFLAFNDGGKVGLWLNADVKLGGGFDETFYLAKNPDVAAAVSQGWLSSGFVHWLAFGQAEGRAAIDARSESLYDEVGYLAANPDVAAAVAGGGLRSGWEHYSAYGKSEGRPVTVLFDKDYYLGHNADVKAAGVDAFAHFMNYGWREGRDPSAYMDVSAYLDVNQDLKAAGVNPLTHYLQYGQGEGRLLVAAEDLNFDWTYLG